MQDAISLSIMLAVIAVWCWLMVCSIRAWLQRWEIAEWAWDYSAGNAVWRLWVVSYPQHMFHLMTFRDPFKLYGLRMVNGKLFDVGMV